MIKRRLRKSIRLNIIISAFFALLAGFIAASIFVIIAAQIIYKGKLTHENMMGLTLIACFVLVLISGLIMWFGSKHLIKPILMVNEAVKKVSHGDFSVQIPRRYKKNAYYDYGNEIDELSENFNRMTKELGNMEYMRKDFMSNVSHEIKTPVAAITGFTEILLDSDLEKEEQMEYLEYVNAEAIRLSRLCENMLQMSRLDHQVIVNNKTSFYVDEQIRNCVIMLSEKWIEKDVHYDLDLQSIEITSSYDLLYLVWTNLIDNAIKYSKDGIKIGIKSETGTSSSIRVEIKDQGIGIPEDKLERIFEKFYQCEESHKKQGSGLGLSIVSRILELLCGEIQCESEEGKGTTMIVRLPISIE